MVVLVDSTITLLTDSYWLIATDGSDDCPSSPAPSSLSPPPPPNPPPIQAKKDIESIFATGLFEDVSISPSTDDAASTDGPQQVAVTVNVTERKPGGLSAGGGLSAL